MRKIALTFFMLIAALWVFQVSEAKRVILFFKPSSGYSGPGDSVTFNFWGGLRGYSAAYAAPGTNPAIDILDTGGGNAATINILSTGALDTTTLNTWIVAHGTATINRLYDQTGGGNHLTAPINRPNYSASPIGILGDGSTRQELQNTSALTFSQPYAIYGVAMSTVGTSDSSGAWGSPVTTDVRGSVRATNLFGIYASGVDFVTATGMTTNNYHALVGVYNGNSSLVAVDGGTSGTGGGGLPGTAAITGLQVGRDGGGGGAILNGGYREIGVINGATTINSSVITNMKTYWGIP